MGFTNENHLQLLNPGFTDAMPQYSASETPRPHGRHNLSRASSYSTQARENTSRLGTEIPQRTRSIYYVDCH